MPVLNSGSPTESIVLPVPTPAPMSKPRKKPAPAPAASPSGVLPVPPAGMGQPVPSGSVGKNYPQEPQQPYMPFSPSPPVPRAVILPWAPEPAKMGRKKLPRVRLRRVGSPRRYSHTHQEFVDKMLENQQEPTTSLVYADHLEENGMPTAAHIVRGHVARNAKLLEGVPEGNAFGNHGANNRGAWAADGLNPHYTPFVSGWHYEAMGDPRVVISINHRIPGSNQILYHSLHFNPDEAPAVLDRLEAEGLAGVDFVRRRFGIEKKVPKKPRGKKK